MPEIEISADQRDYLEELRERLAAEHVGEYGTVRPRDAVQFLIDRHEASAEGETATGEAPGTDAGDTGDAGSSEDDGSRSGADRLEAMMNLLDEHADKWEEADSEEGKYAVELPDGGRETVRTKDDVRALLFKHY